MADSLSFTTMQFSADPRWPWCSCAAGGTPDREPAVGPTGGRDRRRPDRRTGDSRHGAGGSRGLLGGSRAAYLVLGVGLWWGVWSTHPTAVTTCGCGDAARFLWFFQWPAFALAHGHNVLYSTWLFHPGGINLLDDTSVVALGVVLAPVTWLWGPVASMNVALTLAPVLSALSMFLLLRRWVPLGAGRLPRRAWPTGSRRSW